MAFVDIHLGDRTSAELLEDERLALPPTVLMSSSDVRGEDLAATLGVEFLRGTFALDDVLCALRDRDEAARVDPFEEQIRLLRTLADALEAGHAPLVDDAVEEALRVHLGRGVDAWTARKLRAQLAARTAHGRREARRASRS